MKKKLSLLAVLLFLAIFSVILAGIFWLRPSLENQVKSCIDEINASGASVSIDYDRNALTVSPVTRTVHFKSVILTSNEATMPAKVVMDNLTVQVATDMLLLDQNNLPDNGTVLLASHISIDNLSVTLPDCTLSVEHHEMDNVTCGASPLRNVVGNQEMPDIQAIVSQLGAERSESRNVLYSMERSTRRLAIARILVQDWKGSDMGQCALGSIDLADQTGASVQIAQLQMEKVHLPDARTLSRIRQMAATDNPEATLPAISELLTGETVPPV